MMKGLFLKDYYMMIKYCKSFLIILIGFTFLSLLSKDNLFFLFYPCMISAMLPITLLGYDEKSKWNEYVGALPYKKTIIVNEKYLFGLCVQLGVFILIAIICAVRMNISSNFVWKDYMVLISMVFVLSFISSSISQPFIYKFGVEKGRIAYYILIGVVCAGSALASTIYGSISNVFVNFGLPVMCVGSVLLYVLSWYLSVRFYNKREYGF